jgi:hypothetical protein
MATGKTRAAESLFGDPLTIVLEDEKLGRTLWFELPLFTDDHLQPLHPLVAGPAAMLTRNFFEMDAVASVQGGANSTGGAESVHPARAGASGGLDCIEQAGQMRLGFG